MFNTKFATRSLASASGSLLLLACASDRAMAPERFYRTDAAPRAAITSHVVIISIDGLRPDAITDARMPTLARIAREGSHTFGARTILPSKTLPSHVSMLTGVPPTVHGVTWNEDETGDRGTVGVPTVFSVARAGGMVTAAFFSKTKFHHLEVPGSLDHSESPASGGASRTAAQTMGDVSAYLTSGDPRPNLMFVHVGEPDYAGHEAGWMSEGYLNAVRTADSAVAQMVTALDGAFGRGSYTLIVTADHGGHAKTHGSGAQSDVTIPWVIWGDGVVPGLTLTTGVKTMDTAATALWALGVGVPGDWAGAPVDEAFTAE